jgi:acyl dehydratase
LQVVPSMATVLASTGFWWKNPQTGVDWVKLVYAAQDIRVFRPLPPEGTVIGRNRVIGVTDKGEGRGAIVQIMRELVDQKSGEKLAEVHQVSMLRGDGGYSQQPGAGNDPGPEALPAVPERAPDIALDLAVLPQAALIYRLSGDYNTLHADPEVAARAGFKQPILHGLCTYGMAAYAALKTCCDNSNASFKRLAVRFTSPVYPGETIRFEIWQQDAKTFCLRARVEARDVIVLNNGVVELY